MRVLVTGACGFVGAHLVARLVRAGHEVTATIQNPACRFDPSVRKISFDLTRPAEVEVALLAARPAVVLHLAAQSLVMQAWVADKPVVIVLLDSQGKMTRVGDANRIKRWMESASLTKGARPV